MATTQQITTAEQLLLRASELGPCELVGGELTMMTPAGFEHGRIAGRIIARLGHFVEEKSLGVVTNADTGFLIARNPDTVRAPDVAFIAAERVPWENAGGFFPGAPDLAVEVVSPNDRASEFLAKVQSWLGAGSRLVWVVDPEVRTISVYHGQRAVVLLRRSDILTGEDVLPAFAVAVGVIFAR